MQRKISSRGGFTLVEMLVVVAIIGILAAIVVPVVFGVLGNAADARIAIEVADLQEGFQQYLADNNEYPPNFAQDGTEAAVNKHIRNAKPRWTGTFTDGLDPAEALVFWLRGYGPNPANPFAGTRKVYKEFDETRLVDSDGDGYFTFYPQSGQNAPYIYIHHDSYATVAFTPAGTTGTAKAYHADVTSSVYAHQDTFQIISAGQDGNYGANVDKSFPSGTGYDGGDLDNITNFSEGTLKSKQ